MAIFTPGIAVGQISGRVGGSVFSRNRGGAYIRNGSIPSVVLTAKALEFKSFLASASQAWRGLSSDVRQAWTVYAQAHPSINRLGRSVSLTGQNWYVRLNTRLLAAGAVPISAPPTDSPPPVVVVDEFTVDAGPGATELSWLGGALAAGEVFWIRGAKVNSAAINNVSNLLTTVTISAAAAASPLDLEAALIDAFGPLQVGATYVLEIRTLDTASGLVSGRQFARTLAVDTTP